MSIITFISYKIFLRNLLCFFTFFVLFPTVSQAKLDKQGLDVMREVIDKIDQRYVKDVKSSSLIEGAVNGMLQSLDPYSSYFSPEDYKQFQMQTAGQFWGLGVEIIKNGPFIRIIAPLDDMPAAKAGIKANDFITHINNDSVAEMTINKAVSIMRGSSSGVVNLKILRGSSQKIFNFSLNREKIFLHSVKSYIDKDVAVLRVSNFNQETYSELLDAIRKSVLDAKSELIGVILDLRNNPGGLFDQAVEVANLFLPDKSKIVGIKTKNGKKLAEINANGVPDVLHGMPLVILINRGSASASEILTGAMRDNNRAVLVGERTFGKGAVQELIPLLNIPGAAIKLTMASYYRPNGEEINRIGIKPDVEVIDPDDVAVEGEVFSSAPSDGKVSERVIKTKSNKRRISVSAKREIDAKNDESDSQDIVLSRALDLIRNGDEYKKILKLQEPVTRAKRRKI